MLKSGRANIGFIFHSYYSNLYICSSLSKTSSDILDTLILLIFVLYFSEGPSMRKILNQLDSLETVLPVEFADFLTFLRAFKKVRDAAFNSVSYDRNCPIYINEVVTSLEALKQFGVTGCR